MRHAKKAAPPPDPHRCTDACTCHVCGGPTWYYGGKHACWNAACAATR